MSDNIKKFNLLKMPPSMMEAIGDETKLVDTTEILSTEEENELRIKMLQEENEFLIKKLKHLEELQRNEAELKKSAIKKTKSYLISVGRKNPELKEEVTNIYRFIQSSLKKVS
ncbi:hypothetical protein [Halobacteriovorax sp. ZH2_bin.1]|uniref:hypothetical protein n=1 Tax=unclassified Halobacteriovorax TaxID=2639665 RepID=UPI00371307A6